MKGTQKKVSLPLLLISISIITLILFSLATHIYAAENSPKCEKGKPCNHCVAREQTCIGVSPDCPKPWMCQDSSGNFLEKTDACTCADNETYNCMSDTYDISPEKHVWQEIWSCKPREVPSTILKNLKVTVPDSATREESAGSISIPVSWSVETTDASLFDHCDINPNDYLYGLRNLGQSGNKEIKISVTPYDSGAFLTVICYDKNGGSLKYETSIKITNAKPMPLTVTPNIPVSLSTNESCYDKAHSIWELLFKGIDTLISIIFWVLAWLFRSALQWIIIPVFLWILNPNNWGGMAGGNPIVSGLWSSVKDIANIGLLLAVVVIAIATIFRVKKYEVKSTILILIAVALLINFSLTLCGIAIDFSNYLTLYFLNSGQTGNLANNIAATLDQIACATQHFPASDFPSTISAIVILILSIILIGQFIGLAAYAAVRVVTLWITTILSPLAMVAAILPATKQVWKTWLNYFLTYIFGIPAIAFSLWFVLSISYGAASHIIDLSKTGGFIVVIAYAIVWIILFQIPLIVANFLNAGTMGKAYDWTTKKIRGWLMGGAALAGGAIAKKAMTSRTATGAAERLKKISPTLGLAFEKKIKEIRDKEIKKRGESLAATNDYKLLSGMLKDPRYRNPEARLAILSRLAEIDHGKHLTTDPQIYKNYLSLREKYKDTGEIKNIEKLMPSWKEIPQDYLQLVPAKQNEHLQTFVKKLLDIAKSKDQAKEVNWLATFEDARLRGFLGHLAPELISNLSVGQFINIINAISPDKRFIFIKDYMLMPYRQAGKDLQAENPALHKWLKTGTLGGAPLMQQEIADLSSKGLI